MSNESYSSATREIEDSEESEYDGLSTNETENSDPPQHSPPNSDTHLRPEVDQLQSIGLCMALNMSPADDVPKSCKLAMSTPHWKEAMEREKTELESMKAWELVPRPSGVSICQEYGDLELKGMNTVRWRDTRPDGAWTGQGTTSIGNPNQRTHPLQSTPA